MELGIRAPDQAALDTFEQYWGAPAAGVLGFGDASTPAASVARVTADAPMFAAMDRPVNWAIPLAWNGISMADVAAGKYDSYFQQMAATISANSSPATDPNIYVRIGWEATNSYPWKVQVGANKTFSDSLAADYVAAFKHVADIFRAADSRVKIEWNQNYSNQDVNRNYYDLTKLYPGDDYVDVVAVDMYNVSKYSGQDNPVTAWSYKLNAPYGLNWFANFATDHSKPLAITEFGIDADNFQYYVQKLTQFMADNNVIYANYWNQNAGGNGNDTLTDGSKPSTAAAFLTYFAGQERALTLTGGDATNDTLIGGIYGDTISGLAGNDTLTGNAGNDTLDGGAGADTMIGGTGDDIYYVDNSGDVVTENAGEGIDTVRTGYTYALPANVENLQLLYAGNAFGTGNALDNVITGNTGNNTLYGLAGNDTLLGGAGADTLYGGVGDDYLDGGTGADTMVGGTGNDSYYVDDAGDVVVEKAGEGTDTVRSTIAYTLGANVENLDLLGTADSAGAGNALDNVITGNSGNNLLQGFDGNDTLSGGAGNDTLDGGTGADTMAGGTGDDIYYVDDSGDVVIENAGEGTDTVRSTIAYTLGADVENLGLLGTGDITGTGNALDNVITGNSGNNTLYGLAGNDTLDGGAGADTMIGGTGDDIYYVDDAGDTIIENGNEGTDTVRSTIAYTLGANVENLDLLGTGDIAGTGNALDNVITGNSGNNALQGFGGNDRLIGGAGNDTLDGGAGADTMIGGTGDDIYYVDNSGDVVTENAGEGIDTVRTGYTYTLGANVENLQMLYTGNAWGTGNALDNVITGNPGNNTIKGLDGNDTLNGGGGFDTLYGGAGQDVFAFTAALNPTVNLATIADFSPQNDQIALDHTVFAGLSVGALLSTSFASTTAPEPTSAAILYDGQTGKLYFDADGAGGNDPLQFATLSGAPAIGAGSFRVT